MQERKGTPELDAARAAEEFWKRRLRFGKFELDSTRGELWCDGSAVEIQARPLRLLAYLAEHAGRVLSRDELLHHVWDGVIVSDAALSTALKQLRQILEDRTREPPWIETLRGRGIRFNAPVERAEAASEAGEFPHSSSRSRHTPRAAVISAIAASLLLISCAAVWISWPRPFALVLDWTQFGEIAREPPLPDQPSIVVLPFVNMSGDRDQEHFCDGITEEITADLSRNPTLFVISRNSAFTFKGQAVDARTVGRQLGVRFLVEGSVRRTGDRMRITVQLIDTQSGGHVWSQHFDRGLGDVLTLQSEISAELQLALRSEIHAVEANASWGRGTDNPVAHDHLVRGEAHLTSLRREQVVFDARRHLRRAIELDPEYAAAHALLGSSYAMELYMGWSRDRRLLDRAEELVRRANELAPELGDGWVPLSTVLLARGRVDEALEAADRAVELKPNLARAHLSRVSPLAARGRFIAAMQAVEAVRRFDPLTDRMTTMPDAHIRLLAGQVDEAIELFERARSMHPDLVVPRVGLAAYFEARGDHAAAAELVDEILDISPDFTAEWGARLVDEQICDNAVDVLVRAGLPRS